MNSKIITLIALLSVNLCSCVQDKIVELPLTIQNGYGPFNMGFAGMRTIMDNEGSPWKNTYPKISKFPEGLTDMKYNYFETNIYQAFYQDYLLGNITKGFYEEIQKSANWIPDTANLSRAPIKTKIAYAYGKDSEGTLKIAVDMNNNLDLSDDNLFTPLDMNSIDWSKEDSIAQAHAINVSFEVFVHNKIVSVSVPLFIYRGGSAFMSNFAQYATTQYKGEKIAVSSSSFSNLSYNEISVSLINDLKVDEKVKREDIYRKNEYIEIKNEIYKILGVNTNKNKLVLEKNDLPKTQFYTTQIGFKPYPFQGEEFTTNAAISLESFKGKYVFLDFWAEWCGPCIAEFPHLKELHSKIDRTKFEIIGIAGQSTPNGIKRLIEQHEITWTQILSDDIVKTYEITSFPTTILLDTEGFIVAKDLRGEELEEKILSLIKE